VVSRLFPVAMARGKHLFPFRTEQLSPSAPMVLGSQGPGRVGRRRFFPTGGPPAGGPPVVARRHLAPQRLGAATLVRRARALLAREIATARWARSAVARCRRAAPARCLRTTLVVAPGRCACELRRHGSDGTEAGSWRGRWLARAALAWPPAQRRPMPVGAADVLVPVDLPVDVVVVLEQQERAGEPQRREGVLRER
jgi:hypothetical protein